MINKLRALNSWYTKGLDNGSHLRVAINAAESIPQLRDIIEEFFLRESEPAVGGSDAELKAPRYRTSRVPQLHHLIVIRQRRTRGAREEPADRPCAGCSR